MIGGNIFGSSAFLIFGASSQFGDGVSRILLYLAALLGLLVVTSFITTHIIRFFIK